MWSVLAIFLILCLCSIGLAFAVLPALLKQVIELFNSLPTFLSRVLEKTSDLMAKWGFEGHLSEAEVLNWAQLQIAKISGQSIMLFTNQLRLVFGNALDGILFVINFFLIPVFFFYLIMDYERIRSSMQTAVPEPILGFIRRHSGDFQSVLKGYFRGQILVCLILAVLYSVSLASIGLKFGFVIGLLTGLFSLIPYVGFSLGVAISFLIAFAEHWSFGQLLVLGVIFSSIQVLESFVFTPKLVGNSLGISPLTTLIALIIGGNLLGLVGMLIAIPAAALIHRYCFGVSTSR